MSPCNVSLARYLEQLQLRAEYLRQQRVRPEARAAVLVPAGGGRSAPLEVSVRAAPSAAGVS
ncbi:MAG TPA: hypothetical protein VFB81_15380 [Myxococcales bacterium]|nr:hypothetical protein [Myxococcales bacterium]